jgi:hypothetical protein
MYSACENKPFDGFSEDFGRSAFHVQFVLELAVFFG